MWKYMHQVTPDKLRMIQCNLAFWIPFFLPACRESDFCFCHREDPAVGDGDLMGIAPQVFNGISKTIEGFFGLRAPVFIIQGFLKFIPFIMIPEFFAGRRKRQFSFLVKCVQKCKELAFEFIPEFFYGYKKAFTGFSYPAFRSESAS